MPRGYISIGSNIDRVSNIASSLRSLENYFGQLQRSAIYETESVGFSGDPFYNLVVSFNSDLEVKAIAKILKKIELNHGRLRDSKKFSSRTLDLDLLLYGDAIISDGRLQLPRDEIIHYAFVLEPLAEIAPQLMHPILHETYSDLWEEFDKSHLSQTRITDDSI